MIEIISMELSLLDKIQKISEHYDKYTQIRKSQEECQELLDELYNAVHINDKITLPDNTWSEVADVMIMCIQIAMQHEKEDKVREWINYKVDRQLRRIENENPDSDPEWKRNLMDRFTEAKQTNRNIRKEPASSRGKGIPGFLKKMERQKKIKCELYRDSMQNYKKYAIPPAQLIIADVPYNVGNNFYGSNPMWYNGGDNKNGESKLAGKAAFNSDFNFNLYEYFHFCSKMLKKEDRKPITRGRSSNSPCMIVFCSFEQIQTLINAAAKHGFVHYIPLVFCKNYSPQVLKANMRIVGATEYALVLYRDRLPKFRNGVKLDENGKTIRGTGHMIFNWFTWEKDGKEVPKIHPAQKPIRVLKRLIEIFTDPGDVVIDPCAGSGSTLRAAHELGRSAFGFEIDRTFYNRAKDEMLNFKSDGQMSIEDF